MKYRVTPQVLDITSNTTLQQQDIYGGWFCTNEGTADVTVMGYTLHPGQGLNFLDAVQPGSWWDSAIQIRVQPGGRVRITRLQYVPTDE